MSALTTCENPMCACVPCTCALCRCGAARLGELERRVMGVFWDDPDHELTGRNVADALPDYAYTTMATVLDRLYHKGLLRRRVDGRTIRFAAIGTRAAHTAVLMHESLDAAADPEGALARFAETLSHSEAEVLRQTLDRLEHKTGDPGN
ncbi:MAG: BlaI/MecI/CopY family transcriptional regulator [Acidimicrobiales bacterium]